MDELVTVQRMQIERIITYQSWRLARSAKFQTPRGYFLVDVWFEDGKPEFQFRSNAHPVAEAASSLEAANMLATAIQMAIAWAVQEMMLMAKSPDELTTEN